MSRDDTLKMLAQWWDAEPEYALPEPKNPEEWRSTMQTTFFNIVEAIGRRDWRWRIEEDDMWSTRVCGEGGYFAKPHTGTSTTGPDHFGMVEALLEAYLSACADPENKVPS